MKLIVKVLTIGILLASCQSCSENSTSEQLVIDTEAKSRLDSTLMSFVSDGLVAGASALVFEKGEEAYFNAFGYADLEGKVPMDRNTIVTIYSMTKPITGVSLMTLYEKGAFELGDSLAKYAPEFTIDHHIISWYLQLLAGT